MRKILLLAFIVLSALEIIAAKPSSAETVKEITSTEFKKLVSNYEDGYKSWEFKGARPAIIHFYASWCGPSRQLSPILLELAKEYKGNIDFYKVNVDVDDNNHIADIAIAYSVKHIPMLMLAPVTGNPQVLTGLYPKDEIIKAINLVFYY